MVFCYCFVHLIAGMLFAAEDSDRLSQAFSRLRSENYKSIGDTLELCQSLTQSGRYLELKSVSEEAWQQHPKHPKLAVYATRASLRLGLLIRAEKYWEECRRLKVADPDLSLLKIDFHLAREQWTPALALARSLAEQFPRDDLVKQTLSLCLVKEADQPSYAQAKDQQVALYKEALQWDGRNGIALLGLGEHALKNNQVLEAIDLFKQSLEGWFEKSHQDKVMVKDNLYSVYLRLGNGHLVKKQFQLALDAYRQAKDYVLTRKGRENLDHWIEECIQGLHDQLINAGAQALASGQTETAKSSFDEALLLKPSSGQACYFLSEVYRQQSDWNQALVHGLAAIGHDHSQALYHFACAEILLKLNQPQEVMTMFLNGFDQDSESESRMQATGRLAWLILEGHLGGAQDHAVLQERSQSWFTFFKLVSEGSAQDQAALGLCQDFPGVLFALARVSKNNQQPRATRILGVLLDLLKDETEAWAQSLHQKVTQFQAS